MSTTNLGNQYIAFDYKHPAKGADFNTLLHGAVKPGVYSGGDISITGANTISVAPMISYLESDTDKIVKVETRAAVAITVTESTPVLSITYPWLDVSENYLDWNQRAHGSAVITNEVCLGEMVFSGGAIVSVDYSVKDWGKQYTSDVLTGQSPIVVASTTKVTNFNSDQVDNCDVETYLTNSSSKIPRSDAIVDVVRGRQIVETGYVVTTDTLQELENKNLLKTIKTVDMSVIANYTLQEDDGGSIIFLLNSAAPTYKSVIIPSGEISVGSQIDVLAVENRNPVRIDFEAGITLYSSFDPLMVYKEHHYIINNYKVISLLKTSANTWFVSGNEFGFSPARLIYYSTLNSATDCSTGVVGTATLTSASTIYNYGKFGGALGDNNGYRTGTPTKLSINNLDLATTEDISFMCWTSQYHQDGGTTGYSTRIYFTADTYLIFAGNSTASGCTFYVGGVSVGTPAINLKTAMGMTEPKFHLLIRYSPKYSTFTIRVNNVLTYTYNGTLPTADRLEFQLYGHSYGNNHTYPWIDNLKVYKGMFNGCDFDYVGGTGNESIQYPVKYDATVTAD